MGNQPISLFEQSVWMPIDENGNRTILQNSSSLREVQKYYASTVSQSIVNLEGIFQWRCNLPPSSYVVEILQYGIKETTMCDHTDEHYVITERVHRLGEIPQISKYQGLLVIKQTLQGLKTLSSQFGLFSPDLMNIGVNEEGQIRVWVNQNYALNVVREDKNGHPHREEAVVNNLCNLISSRVFNNSLRGQYPYGYDFDRAIKSIENQRRENKDIAIPKIFSNRERYTQYYLRKNKIEEQELLSRVHAENSIMTYGITEENSHKKIINFRDHSYSREIRNSNEQKQQYLEKVQQNPQRIAYQSPPILPKYQKPNKPPSLFVQPQKLIPNPQKIVRVDNPYYNNPQQIVRHPPPKIGKPESITIKKVNSANNVGSKKQILNDKSQIRLKDDIEEVDSVIVAQDDYMEERDKVPISQGSFMKQLGL